MRVLIVGSGAREHALTWAFSRSKRLSGLFVAPGNAGTAALATNLPHVAPTDFDAVVAGCVENDVDLVLVGPEAPLAEGLVDRLISERIPCIGPHKAAAQLESSKTFSKDFMGRHGIPTAGCQMIRDVGALDEALAALHGRGVVKCDGLAAGKGVLASDDKKELRDFAVEALAGGNVLLEEFLEGYELSIFLLMDGKDYVLLPPCADFKKAQEGERGPNTGGMGSICPVPWVDTKLFNSIESRVVLPTLEGMRKEGLAYKGVLYIGVMVTENGPKVLEYNVRFGDPETQVLVPIIISDFCNIADAIVNGTLLKLPLRNNELSAAGIVVASAGYPGDYPTNVPVQLDPLPSETETFLFHASTHRDDNNRLLTGGGRCFTVVGTGKDMLVATENAYRAVKTVRFEGGWHRSDIGNRMFMD